MAGYIQLLKKLLDEIPELAKLVEEFEKLESLLWNKEEVTFP